MAGTGFRNPRIITVKLAEWFRRRCRLKKLLTTHDDGQLGMTKAHRQGLSTEHFVLRVLPSKLVSVDSWTLFGKSNLDFIQRLKLEKRLIVHKGCVNTICWNETGTTLLSGSDDQHLVISDPFSEKTIHKFHAGHPANIFSAKFLPSTGDQEVISCSGDGKIIYNNILREDTYGANVFDCHFGTTYEVIVIPNEASTFLSCGEDGTVRFFDLRAKQSCNKADCKEDVLINSRSAVTSITANPLLPWQLAVGCSDSTTRVYDRRMLGTRATGNYQGKGISGLISLFTPPSLESMSYRITSLNYSPDGEDILVSYSSEYIYLFGTKDTSKFSQLNKTMDSVMEGQSKTNIDDPSSDQPSSIGSLCSAVDDSSRPSSVKRLRLRGDWSDTGPCARPERERRQNPRPPVTTSQSSEEPSGETTRITIMQRMSDLLTRWLDGNLRQNPQEEGEASGESDQPTAAQQSSSAESGTLEEAQGTTGVVQYTGSPSSIVPGSQDTDEQVPSTDVPVTMETDDSTVHTNKVSENNRTDEPDASLNDETDMQSVINEASSDMYNPLEPTSYLEQARGNVSDSDIIKEKEETSSCVHQISNRSDETCDNESAEVNSSVTASIRDSINSAGGSKSENSPEAVAMTTPFDDSPRSGFIPEERSIVDQTRQTVEELKTRNVAPIISLHYSTEGTSYSNIHLQFASVESTTETQGEAGVGSSSQDGNQGIPVHQEGYHDNTDNVETAQNLPESEIKTEVDSFRETINQITFDTDETVNDMKCIDSCNDTPKDSCQNDKDKEINVPSGTHSAKVSEVEINFEVPDEVNDMQEEFDNVDKITDGRNRTRDSEVADDTAELQVEFCNNEKNRTVDTEVLPNKDEHSAMETSDSEPDKVKTERKTDKETVSCDKADADKIELSRSVVTMDTEQSGCSGCEVGVLDTGKPVPVLTTPGTDGKTEVEKMDVDYSFEMPSTSGASARKPRQRKKGYSGSPTGALQLPSADDPHHSSSSSSSSDDDDNNENMPRNLLRKPRIDRTTAALRLQALHRKRQEAKEKKEMDVKSIYKPTSRKVYKGHRNARTMIKEANFWGNNYILSGSDCGHVFIWDRNSTEPVMLLEADKHVVNCVQPHPFDVLLASSGIDYDIKLWSPLHEQSAFDEVRTKEVIHRNQIMLEETRDTITVPAAFMLRVLASINNIRSGRRTDRAEENAPETGQREQESDSE